MELNANKFAAAAAISTAIIWVICSLLVVSMPDMTMQASGRMMHMDLSETAWNMHATGFVLGLILWTAIVAVSTWVFAIIYNRLL